MEFILGIHTWNIHYEYIQKIFLLFLQRANWIQLQVMMLI